MSFFNSVRPAHRPHFTVAAGACALLFSSGMNAWADDQQTLPTVIVTASRLPQLLQTAPIGASIITSEQIQRSGVSDANEAIRKLGGVSGKSDLSGGREYKLDLRGYGDGANSNTVVLVDGIRISENELMSARLSAIPLDQIDRIEIVRGGASVLWGEGAAGGVINVVLKHNAHVGASGHISGSVESFGGSDLLASGTQQVGSVAVDGSIRRLRSEGYRDRSLFKQDSGGLGLLWIKNGWSQSLRVQQENQFSQWPGYLTFTQFLENPRQARELDQYGYTQETRFSSHTEYKNRGLTAQLDLGSRDRDADYSGTYQRIVSAQQVTPKISYLADWGGVTANTIVGIDFQRWTLDQIAPWGNDHGSHVNKALFAHSDWTLPTGTRLAFGGRTESIVKRELSDYSQYERRNSLQSSELGVSQDLAKDWSVYGRLAQSYRLPNFDENGSTPDGSPLRPQRGRDKEVGLKWAQGGHAFSARYFRQDNVDEIAYVPSFTPGTFGFNENIDPTRRQGVEFEGRWTVASSLELRVNLQHLSAKYRSGVNTGKDQVLVASQTASVRVAYRITDHQTLDAGVQYLGAMRFGDDVSNQCDRRIPESALLDARYAWSDKLWTLAVSGTNLTDQQGYNYGYKCAFGALYPEPGRALKLTVSRQF